MINDSVFIGQLREPHYPDSDCFSPSQRYPEYMFSDIESGRNEVYDVLRQGLFELGFDVAKYGSAQWNPFGEFIKEGDTVLIKPNWVFHKNREPIFGELDCMVTHPSIIRVVVDYVVIALKGTGRIIIGDSPIQLCDFSFLMEHHGYNNLWQYYENQGVQLEVVDFRGVLGSIQTDSTFDYSIKDDIGVEVDLGTSSLFDSVDLKQNLRITNYSPAELGEHHNDLKHRYSIHPLVLNADVIINLPKPKSHRKAGVTACLKNFVGTNARKECLPHHTKYSQEEGGDEYSKKSKLRRIASDLQDQYLLAAFNKKPYAKSLTLLTSIINKIGRILSRDNFTEGSWYGNDTIWRTIVDLFTIIQYSDKEGILQHIPQRKIFNICDMIVTGEKEGPLSPSPKPIGVLLMGSNSLHCDLAICKIFGCDCTRIKYLNYLLQQTTEDKEATEIIYNMEHLKLDNFHPLEKWKIEFSNGWHQYLS